MFDYRTTPHCTTGVSPAELLMGRKLRGSIPHVESTSADKTLMLAQKHDREQKDKMKKYADNRSNAKVVDIVVGDKVIIRQKKTNKLSAKYDKIPYEVIKRHGPALTLQRHGKITMRNVSLVKKLPEGYWTNSRYSSSDSSEDYGSDDGSDYGTMHADNDTIAQPVAVIPAPTFGTPAPESYSRSNRRVRAPRWQADYQMSSP